MRSNSTDHDEHWQKPFFDLPDDETEESDLDQVDPDDPQWDALIPEDDERDPQPEYGDFWPAG